MAGRKGLGRGLDNLIPTGDTEKKRTETIIKEKEVVKEVIKEVPADTVLKISEVEPNKDQPRENFDEEELMQLADSVKKYGIIQPITVVKKKDYYQIVAGERRYRAARLAGLKEIPVIIKKYSDSEVAEIALIENLQRVDLDPIEEAKAYKRLIEEFNLKQEEVAEKVSKNRTTITNSLRLLKLDDEIQKMLITGDISTGHAKLLVSIEDVDLQKQIANQIIEGKLSVRETEKLIKKLSKEKKDPLPKEKVSHEYIYRDVEEKLKHVLGAKIEIKPKTNEKGKIEISYFTQDELERLTELMYSINRDI